MARYGRSDEEIALELAYCAGNGLDPLKRFRRLTARRWRDV